MAASIFSWGRLSLSFATDELVVQGRKPFIGLLVKCQALDACCDFGPTGRKRHRMNPRLVGAAKAYNEGGG